MFTYLVAALAGPLFALLPAEEQRALTDCGVDAPALEALLQLDQRAFDQDFSGGWRKVSSKPGCSIAAGHVIKAYILYAHPIVPSDLGILRWHAGQAYASGGDYDKALAFFAGTYNADASDDDELWNLYVDATIAFLQGDADALNDAYTTLSAMTPSEEEKAARRKFLADNPTITMPDGFVDEPQNLSVVRCLKANLGKSYRDAYRARNCAA